MRFFLALYLMVGWAFLNDLGAVEYKYPALKQLPADFELPEGTTNHIEQIRIFSTTDNSAMKEVLEDFQKFYPYVQISYHELQSLELFERVRSGKRADLVISSAMDLQMKLVNDGYAQEVDISVNPPLPSWAVWRNEAFGTTFEPAVIIYHKPYFKNKPVPRNRAQLIAFLEDSPDDLKGKIATYDIEKSGLGYMFLSRDDSQYSATWDLVRALGRNGVQRIPESSKIIDGVSSGRFKIGYNVLGTYAVSRLADDPDLGVIVPEDYTIALTRLAFIPKTAQSVRAGRAFLEYMLSERGQKFLTQKAQLNAINRNVKSPHPLLNELHNDDKNIRPIKVSPGLLVYLDQMKKDKMFQRWRKALNLDGE